MLFKFQTNINNDAILKASEPSAHPSTPPGTFPSGTSLTLLHLQEVTPTTFFHLELLTPFYISRK
jgi:hypothetical protein